MNSPKTFLILGIVFLANGVTFLGVGLATGVVALWGLAPAFITLGATFLAISKSRTNAGGGSDGSANGKA